jgi:hypothetical protein
MNIIKINISINNKIKIFNMIKINIIKINNKIFNFKKNKKL